MATPKSRRLLFLLLVVVLGAAAGGYYYYKNFVGARAEEQPAKPAAAGKRGGKGADPARVTPVGAATARSTELNIYLNGLGTVSPQKTVTVRSRVEGELMRVAFTEGQVVKQGDLLAEIDPRPFQVQLQQAEGQLARDQALLENARIDVGRYRTLLQQDSIARQDVDTQAALVKQLEATVMTDTANEGTARINLGYTRITSPINGRVGLRVVDVGNLVGSSDANGIAVIAQLNPIDVEFAVPQDMVPDVQSQANAGARLLVTAFDRTRTTELAKGVFSTLDNQVDTQTGTVRAKARFTNGDQKLFPSQFVNVRLLLRMIENAVVVPVTALRHGSSGDFVYVLNAADRVELPVA